MVFIPNITTNHYISYTNCSRLHKELAPREIILQEIRERLQLIDISKVWQPKSNYLKRAKSGRKRVVKEMISGSLLLPFPLFCPANFSRAFYFRVFPTIWEPGTGYTGVNVFAQVIAPHENAYVFPPFVLVGPLLRFLDTASFPFMLVIPKLNPLPYWWPLIQAKVSHSVILGRKRDCDVLLFPSPQNVFLTRSLLWDLYTFRIVNSPPLLYP